MRQAREALSTIAGPIQSEPVFPVNRIDRDQTEYLFYKPVLDLVAGAGEDFNQYYRGTVRVAVSTQLILDQIADTRREIILSTTIIAVLAVIIGVVGAFALATIVVIPIDKLVRLVTEISETEDKSELKGKALTLKTKDELNLLATSINEIHPTFPN
ncbi:MAG TPA: HAMP domain-containing protein [Campylobacteraceae bacterium]|nr:HAMP domain-containing protein [Campylobacteraceae bacterium]